MALIRANRESIDDRFSVLGFTVRTENPLFEIGLATDPELLKAENRQRRTASNFYSSHLLGAPGAGRNGASGEAVYLVPPNVVARFVGQPRLYFGLATYQENDRTRPTTIRIPDRGNMYVSLSGLTERGLRRTTRGESNSGYGSNGNALTWGGDAASPVAAKPNGNGAKSNGHGTAANATPGQPAPYSDGYSDDLWNKQADASPAPASTNGNGSAATSGNGAAPTTAIAPVTAQAYGDYGGTHQHRTRRPLAEPLLVSSYYKPTGWFDALSTQVGFFLSSAMWFLGVTDTTVPPHSAICQVRRPDGSAEGALHGSAFFIAPRLLLTAAHVVDGQSELIIVPGKNGGTVSTATEPFGRFRVSSSSFRKHPSYASGNQDFDMALICVPAANAAGADNYFNLVEELTQSRPEGVVVCGYAARWYAKDAIDQWVNDNIDPNKQHMHGGYIRSLPTDETFDYDLQTLGGTSGAPVYWIEDGQRPRAHLVGVHVAAHSETTNLGCRITAAKRQWIAQQAAGLGVSFALARGLGEGDATPVAEEDPDAFGIGESIPDDSAIVVDSQALRTRALEAPLPDYPGASRFVPANARNFTVARGERTIDRVVIHITAGGSRISGTIGWFQNPDQRNSKDQPIRVSSHYIVGRDGEVVQMVRNRDYAHHASQANKRSIGIEHNANKKTGLIPTEEQYAGSARLVAWLCAQYNLPIDREHIVGHQEISPRDNHDCPSSIWNWDHYIDCVRIAAAAMAAPTSQGLAITSRALEIITPFYDPADPSSAISCQADAFSLAREEWFAGVPNTTIFPHSAICLLEMHDGSGGLARGTGFYIGRNRILTCAHNLYGQASVDIVPGKNGQGGGTEPFGRCNVTSSSWRIPASYGGSNPAFDLAVIDNVPIAAPGGRWFDVLEELNQSRPEGVVVCGYSSRSTKVPELTAAIDGFKQHLHAGYIAALGPGDSTFDYPILSLKRASGSPVYYISDKDGTQKAYIVGVHTGSATDDLNRGCRLTTAKINWITGASSSLGATSRTLGNAFSVHWPDVQLIRQTSPMSCWAAAAAMVVGWRDEQSIPDTAIAEKVAVFDAYRRGLYGFQRQKLAEAWDLVAEAPASYTIDGWREMLERNGPLYIDQHKSTRSNAGHVRVLVGMSSGGADDGSDTVMYFHDPADGQIRMAFNDFLRLYEARTGTTGGYLEFQILHADGPVAGRSSSTSAAFSLGLAAPARRVAHALGGDDIDLGDVALIPQPDKNSCWAASMAMLLSWRRKASFSPETLANEVGRSLASSYGWDLLNAVRDRYGFVVIPQPSNASVYNAPRQWAEWLRNHGALWVVIVGAPHAVVLAGIRGNLDDPSSVQVKVLNPWDTRVAFDNDEVAFHPANRGYTDWLPFADFAADFGNMAEANYGNWRVLHLPAAAATAQSLGRRSSALEANADDADVFELAPPPTPVVRSLAAVRALDGGATVAIASVVVGAVMERLVNNDGDITWELEQLRGFKHPNDVAPSPLPPAQDGRALRLNDWPKVHVGFIIKDEISAGFEINWQYNGKSVGNVMISNIATNDAIGWGLSVKAKIMDDNIVYPRNNPTFAALRIRFEFRFSHFVKGDKIAIRDIHLFGDGGYTDDGHWEQT
jgi:V8-like Glu-specific endopeptidase